MAHTSCRTNPAAGRVSRDSISENINSFVIGAVQYSTSSNVVNIWRCGGLEVCGSEVMWCDKWRIGIAKLSCSIWLSGDVVRKCIFCMYSMVYTVQCTVVARWGCEG